MSLPANHQRKPGVQANASRARAKTAAILTAAVITVVDGFDAFSMSLAAPQVISELGISTAALGPVFASTLGGMTIGAFVGGLLADKWGRLRVLMIALGIFAMAALTMAFVSTTGEILVNRAIAGVGLGAGVPIAVALLSQASDKPPSDLVISVVWAGLAVGGILAALFNYLVVPAYGWRSIFIVGGLLPMPVAVLTYFVFRTGGERAKSTQRQPTPRMAEMFAKGLARRTVPTAIMFFFGYMTTAMVVNWLPTVLSHREASPLMVSIAFGSLNIGSAVGSFGLGFLSSKVGHPGVLASAWLAAGLCAIGSALPGLQLMPLAILAVAAATIAAGSQALAVAFAMRLHRERNLESSSVGLMVSSGRIGQFGALGLSGILLGLGWPETGLFAFAGFSACVAALIALLVAKPRASMPDGVSDG